MTRRKSFIVRRTDDAEGCFLEQSVQFLGSTEVIEVAADDGVSTVGNQFRNFVKLLLAHGGVE